ncbi:MAG: alpha-glucosidase [Treponema sp.]|nr:alpha-glucosidase [Treponema sp.]
MWWKNSVVYQIYPRSFQDSDLSGLQYDGIGDIPGIISRLNEIKELGADIIWLSPVYKSPDADNGYDISDYYSINPKFGTMADMEKLFAEAKKLGIKIIMDLVINHTSDEHEWFKKSRDKESPYRDYYIWQQGKTGRRGKRKPPNNWTGFFTGGAWEYDERSGEYYLHLFDKKQPDLNYKNPKVIEEVKNILRFWLDKGASGFRCDVINIIYKTSLKDGKRSLTVQGLEHFKSQEGNHEVLRELRRDVLDKYDCFTVGETVFVGLEDAKLLCNEDRGELNMIFFFDHLEVDRVVAQFIPKKFRARRLLEVIAKWQRGLDWNAVYLENHDQPRVVSHFGAAKENLFSKITKNSRQAEIEKEYWQRSAKMLALFVLTLRGTPFIYQGQEIGMTNFDYESFDDLDDVVSRGLNRLMKKIFIPKPLRWKWIKASSRDNARTPMQWDDSEHAGFSKVKPWLGVNGNYKTINYESQKNNGNSILNFYKKLIALRKTSKCLIHGEFIPVYADNKIIIYQRKHENDNLTTALNFSPKAAKIPKKYNSLFTGIQLISASGESLHKNAAIITLPPWDGMLIKSNIN